MAVRAIHEPSAATVGPAARAPSASLLRAPADQQRTRATGSGLVTHAGDELAADRVAARIGGAAPRTRRASRHDPFAALAAPSIGAAVRRWSGRALDGAERSIFERSIGDDLRDVRLHTGPQADRATAALSARAFATGRHVVFGAGQYDPARAAGRRLLAHELAHTAQQRRLAYPLVQLDAVDDARDKLSYGLFDWAITDAEAIDALALLGTIPEPDLGPALQRLGTKHVTRLLDNLPDAARTGAAYGRVVSTLGSTGTLAFAVDQLSYGLFDWAITSAEVSRVYNLFATLPADERTAFLVGLHGAGRLVRLLAKSPIGYVTMHLVPWLRTQARGQVDPAVRPVLRTIVEQVPDGALDVLVAVTEVRFDVTVGPSTVPGRAGVPLVAATLRATYLALDHLPDAHVARNRELVRLGQFSQAPALLSDGRSSTTAGAYSSGNRELIVNVRAGDDISDTVIHEAGHAVDREMGWSRGPEPARPERGGWKTYRTHPDAATDMVEDSNGAIKTTLDAAQRNDVIDDMASAMTALSDTGLAAAIRARVWFGALDAGDQASVLDDEALAAIPIGLASPWFTATRGGEYLGDHVYQESYTPTWVRYRHEARSRLVTRYQFRAPGEWFAECYAAYYTPDPRGKGAKLADKDPDTKTYFDRHVDTRAPTR